jgi:hypothetical protein
MMRSLGRIPRSIPLVIVVLSLSLPTVVGCGEGSGAGSSAPQAKAAGPASIVETPAPTKPSQPKLDIQ